MAISEGFFQFVPVKLSIITPANDIFKVLSKKATPVYDEETNTFNALCESLSKLTYNALDFNGSLVWPDLNNIITKGIIIGKTDETAVIISTDGFIVGDVTLVDLDKMVTTIKRWPKGTTIKLAFKEEEYIYKFSQGKKYLVFDLNKTGEVKIYCTNSAS